MSLIFPDFPLANTIPGIRINPVFSVKPGFEKNFTGAQPVMAKIVKPTITVIIEFFMM